MFVPSLSWQIFSFQYKMAQKRRFLHQMPMRGILSRSKKARNDFSSGCVQPCCVGVDPLGAQPPIQSAGAS